MKMMQSFSRSFTGLAVLLITAGCGQEAPTQLGEVQRLFQEVDEEVTGAVGDLVPAVSRGVRPEPSRAWIHRHHPGLPNIREELYSVRP